MELVTAEALFHGNVDFTDAKAAESLILSALRGSEGGLTLSKKKFPKELVTQFPLCSDPYIITCPTKNLSEPNTAVEYYFQVGKDETKDRAMLDLLAHMMMEPFYDQLRTKDQFGYVVSCDSRWTSGVMGLYFSVVSSTKSAVSV
jgi:nardilysin